ncbi:protein kinase [Aliivibrio kagoshimensis]|uniref:protein kinase n=1 Tax=Aliivibrio kagoshimensis TaxID=2910230 RepID=UPI003D0B0F8A
MQTLEQLTTGQLSQVTQLQLSEGLTEFPLEILELADTLEVLDLSNNQLSTLPDEFSRLVNLKIVFMSNNLFDILPEVLGRCPKLEMVGFKSNTITTVPEDSLPLNLRWLILTDNNIEQMPDSLGERPRLQKLALAGNQLSSLPTTLAQSHNLQLLRISANQLIEFPHQLLDLPKLAWLAFSGNPFCQAYSDTNSVPLVSASELTLLNVLGKGASGVISKAIWTHEEHAFPKEVAVKVFKGDVTSDGYPEDELQCCLAVGEHPNLVKSIATINEQGHSALVMKLIPEQYGNLAMPPSLVSCTRDTFADDFVLPVSDIVSLVEQMSDVLFHLHAKQVSHGDLYAHNVLFDDQANLLLGDFGASSSYGHLEDGLQQKIERIELRAFGYFIDDLLGVCDVEDQDSSEFIQLQHLAYLNTHPSMS